MPAQPPFAVGSQNTQLDPLQEMAFRQWTQENKVPFNANAPVSDYDMRGFYRGLQQGSPMATSGINPNDQRMHYTDYFKTPLHQSFSSGSQFAGQDAPQWINGSQLASPGGRILLDEKNEQLDPLVKAMMGLR